MIAEDSAVSRHLLHSTLKHWGYEVTAVADGDQAWKQFEAGDAPNLAILDWMMPGLTGPEVCRRIRNRSHYVYPYLLLLTSRNEKQDLVEGMDAGADDYITKPFDQLELKARLRAGTRILDLQAELLAAKEALREQATRDALTSLWNRPAILDALTRNLARAERERTPVAVALLDLDHFKLINDTHGHLAGDAVLREASRRIRSVIRGYDAAGRYGGEEFLVVLPGCDENRALSHAEPIRECLAANPVRFGHIEIEVTASLGVTAVEDARDVRPDDLIHAADDALYDAKRGGRNRVSARRAEPALVDIDSCTVAAL